MKIDSFTYKKFTKMFSMLNGLDDYIDIIYNRTGTETAEKKDELNKKLKEMLNGNKNKLLLMDIIMTILYNKKLSRFKIYVYSKLFTYIENAEKNKNNKLKVIFSILIAKALKIDKYTKELEALFSAFNECMSLCFKVYGAIMLDPPPDLSQKRSPSLKYMENVSGVYDTFVSYDYIFRDAKRVCMIHGCMTDDEVDNTQIVSLFVRYAKLLEKTNGEQNGSIL